MFARRRVSTSLSGKKFKDETSLYFDDSTSSIEHVDLQNTFNPGTGDFTIAFWIKFVEDETAAQYVCSKWENPSNRWYIKTTADQGRLQFYSKIGGATILNISINGILDWSSAPENHLLGTWTHIVFSVDRSNNVQSWYSNGVLKGGSTTDISDTDIDVTSDFNIGAKGEGSGSTLEGNFWLADMALYNRYFSESEVRTLFNDRKPFNHVDEKWSKDLSAWYRMGDGTEANPGKKSLSTLLYDMSNNSNNGTLVAMELPDDYKGESPFN